MRWKPPRTEDKACQDLPKRKAGNIELDRACDARYSPYQPSPSHGLNN
jgi:hypothetical protein